MRTAQRWLALVVLFAAVSSQAQGYAPPLPSAFTAEAAPLQSRICGRMLFGLASTGSTAKKLSPDDVKRSNALLLSGILHVNRTEQIFEKDKQRAHQLALQLERGDKEEFARVVSHCVKQTTELMRSGKVPREEMQRALSLTMTLMSPGGHASAATGALSAQPRN
jgi:hypothetical protein